MVTRKPSAYISAFQAEHDRRFVRTESYLTAQILQGTHGYSSGSERLFELSESSRSTLCHHAKCMGLFQSEASPESRCDFDENRLWREWIRQERLCRLGWAVYVSWLLRNISPANMESRSMTLRSLICTTTALT